MSNAQEHNPVLVKPGRNGAYKISGTITVEGNPASRRLLILKRATFALAKTGYSAADGTYEITDLEPVKHTVLAFDHVNNAYNAVVADLIDPVPMS